MSTRRPLRRRGQNLVLLALTMLFLVLMVTMTLGLGLRIRQKRELQQLADSAAYSNSVMTARAFNNMALINRLQVSYWVAMAADQSLISWTSYAQAMANGTYNAANRLANSSCIRSAVVKDQVIDFRDDVNSYIDREYGDRASLWRQLDDAAGDESLAIQGKISDLRFELSPGVVTAKPDSLREELFRQLRAQQLTNQIIALSRQTADVSIVAAGAGREPNTAAQVSMREVDCDYGGSGDEPLNGTTPGGSGLCLRASMNLNMLQAAMGSRGHSFLTGRSQVPGKVEARLQGFAANQSDVSVAFAKSGSAYWSTRESHGTAASTTESWADDHGIVVVRAGGCEAVEVINSYLKSTHKVDTDDQHRWGPRRGAGTPPDTQPDVHHTMGDCTPLCPSVWVRTIGFSPSDDVNDAYGQPKSMVLLQRDLSARQFPWELHFSFPFSATGGAAEWDARGHRLQSGANRGLNITLQTALATGITYYHRRGHWDEFPNLLNPFWRATLAAQDVDTSGGDDVRKVLGAPGHRWQQDAYDALRAQGYEGLH